MTNLEAQKSFKEQDIKFLEFNNGLHMRVVLSQFQIDGHIDFWPTREKWIYGDKSDVGIFKLIEFLGTLKKSKSDADKAGVNYVSVAKIFDIAKRVNPSNLYNVCEAIHKAIYK